MAQDTFIGDVAVNKVRTEKDERAIAHKLLIELLS
jgi:hypothetical protein